MFCACVIDIFTLLVLVKIKVAFKPIQRLNNVIKPYLAGLETINTKLNSITNLSLSGVRRSGRRFNYLARRIRWDWKVNRKNIKI